MRIDRLNSNQCSINIMIAYKNKFALISGSLELYESEYKFVEFKIKFISH